MRECIACGAEFEPRTRVHRSCSKPCTSASNNAKNRADRTQKKCRTCRETLPAARFKVGHPICMGCEQLRESGSKQCRECSKVKPEVAFSVRSARPDGRDARCKDCRSAASKMRNAAPEKRKHNREIKYRRRYGMSGGDVVKMLERQGGRCSICNAKLDRPHIDHDHRTGVVRSLLCFACNILLGNCSEDTAVLRSAIEYLERHRVA